MNVIIPSIIVAFITIAFYYVEKADEPKLLPIVEGFFQPEFMAVANTLRQFMESGTERGAALAVYYDGELIIDMWAGYADPSSLTRWRNGTTTLAFDCSNAVMAVLIAKMVDIGLLNYSKPIAEYWPEFGGNGKEEINLEQLLSHQAGIPYLSEAISLRDLQSDSGKVEQLLINQKPVWKPGSQLGYHRHTYGLYLDKLLQKVDPAKRDTTKFFEEEITLNYGIDFFFKVKKAKFYKTARLGPVSMTTRLIQMFTSPVYLKQSFLSWFDTQSTFSKTMKVVKEFSVPFLELNNPELREITLSSFSGTGTARGLAKLFSLLVANQNSQRPQLLSGNTLELLTENVTSDTCSVTGQPLTFGRGVQIFRNPFGDTVFGHTGEGGQVVLADPTNRLAIAYLTNHLSVYRNGDDPRFIEVQRHLYNNLERFIHRKTVSGG